ncbi:hypothetical protein MMC10_001473 [Thelotrema lepadinum]|nr:hypothetical protein [Thelotrema lepadinum]
MDVSTDILLITLPTTLLWRVNIARRQKLGLALSLCLSLVISSMAVIKMAGGVTGSGGGGGVDIVWIAFWQQQEASIAVIVISVSAFRSFFVGGTRTSAADRGEGGRGGQRVLKSWPRTRTRTRSGGEGLTAHGEENGLVETESGYELPRMPMAYMVGVRSEDWGREGARPGERESGGRRGVVESEESLLEP